MFTSIQNGEGEFLMDTNAPNLATKDITENGTYNASSDNADGYSSVTVDVSSGGETFEVVFTSDGESVTTVNKTYNEIISAINSGKEIVGSLVFPDGSPLASVPIVKAIVADVSYVYDGVYKSLSDAVVIYTDCVKIQGMGPATFYFPGFIGNENGQDFIHFTQGQF